MEECRKITRSSASNLALAFVLLPRAKREGMSALYAFCREVDDIADDEQVPVERRRAELQAWRQDVKRACAGERPEILVNRELQPVIRQCRLPCELFLELLQGVELDLDIKRYANWEDLEVYCYRVASVVGLLSVEIFEYQDAACRDYAIYLGKALQLTNILRDVGSDATRGRIYLPLSELARHNVSEREILEGRHSPRFVELAKSTAARARHFYRLARETLPRADRRSMIAAELMGSVYWRLLRKLEQGEFQVLGPAPARLSKPRKILLILRTWLRLSAGLSTPNYGV